MPLNGSEQLSFPAKVIAKLFRTFPAKKIPINVIPVVAGLRSLIEAGGALWGARRLLSETSLIAFKQT